MGKGVRVLPRGGCAGRGRGVFLHDYDLCEAALSGLRYW
jgi:hypothetical protein